MDILLSWVSLCDVNVINSISYLAGVSSIAAFGIMEMWLHIVLILHD